MKVNKYRDDLIDLDDSEIRDFLAKLKDPSKTRLLKVQLKKSMAPMVKMTTEQFRKKYKSVGRWEAQVTKKGKIKKKIMRVAKAITKLKNGFLFGKVHIMDNYKVKWLEMGTDERQTKGHRNIGYYKLSPTAKRKYILRTGKPGYRGYVKPGNFFRKSKGLTFGKVVDLLRKGIGSVIKEITSKK